MAKMTIRNEFRDRRDPRSGQTLVIAIIILGILMILGFAFAGIISRNISESGRSRGRSVATDLARAGAEYAHFQLRYSELGADWHPAPTPPAFDAAGFTKDPDALYLRPADPTNPFSNDPKLANVPDQGGPDGYGPYTRVFFDRGRALLRVRYAPFQYDAFRDPNGQLRQPGKARNYLTIEVVGRPGELRTNGRTDPSLELPERVKVTNFATLLEKTTELAKLQGINNTLTNSRKLIAFASIGIIETAKYITNKDHVTRPAEYGFPTGREVANPNRPTPGDQVGVGVGYGDAQAPYANNPDDIRPVVGTVAIGQAFPEVNFGKANNWTTIPGLGSVYCNADLTLYGQFDLVLNESYGDAMNVVGRIRPANSESGLRVSRTYYDRATDQWRSDFGANGSTINNPLLVSGAALDSDQPVFSTIGGILRDGMATPDAAGYVRGIPYKSPPSILTVDPQNKQNRFLMITRESGRIVNNINLGRFGYGRGVYVDSNERGNSNSEDERVVSGAVKALMNDWLNPNNTASQGWKGPYYIPLASYLRLLPDGFEIIRDTRSRLPYWRLPNGQSSGQTKIRYRIRSVRYPTLADPFRPMILNSIQNPTLAGLPGATLTDNDFRQFGQLFNGVAYFEGDVRVRGVIPTDHQLTIVSMGSVYVEGSITKGVIDELTGLPINRPSRSTLMLSARDYVCLNPTMFFGPAAGENVDEKNENAVPDVPNPFELKLEDPDLVLESQFLLDPSTPASLGGNPVNPATWLPYANHYVAAGSNVNLPANMLVSSSADDNGPAFVSLDVLPNSYALNGTWNSYLFPRDLTFGPQVRRFNAAAEFFTGVTNIPVYGLGDPTLNSYPKFETVEFPIVTSQFNFNQRKLVPTNGALGTFEAAVQDPTLFRVRMNGIGRTPMKNFVGAHTAIAPHEIRIEAAMFAEEGSFFVIPGSWFNTSSQDTRRNWLDRSGTGLYPGMTDDQANERRFELFGHTPSVPFFNEPLDVKISIVGAVSENMPAPISAQAEWLKKWGWIPRQLGSTGLRIPVSHTSGLNTNLVPAIPNLTLTYDPVLAASGVWDPVSSSTLPIRTDEYGWSLPPMPRLPVSPTLAYFGEVNP